VLESLRLDSGAAGYAARYGEPAIYIGTISSAARLSFTAVRVLGLAESVFPGTLRGDPILPPVLRDRLPRHTIAHDDEFALMRLQALDQVIRGTRDRIAFSVSRSDSAGGEHEPAGVFLALLAALTRTPAPTLHALEHLGFAPARAAMQARRREAPLTASDWLARIAAGAHALPSGWQRAPITAPVEVRARAATMHGELGPAPLTVQLPGLAATRAISASSLRTFLTCAQRFLLEHVLGLSPRRLLDETHRIAGLAYGTLFHRVVDCFARVHGAAFGTRAHDLAHWLARGDELARAQLAAFVQHYPLLGASAYDAAERRLRRDVRTFLSDDWQGGILRRLAASERTFGEERGIEIVTRAGPLYVHGRIDRIDIEGERTLVRDLKTGRAQPRTHKRAAPDPALDLQLALYVIVTEQLAATWGLPANVVGAYTYVDALAERTRSFREDPAQLRAAGAHWLDVARTQLGEHRFARTGDGDACRSCPFAPVCGRPEHA
ncbi:MAG TPA: PD-(D/E)XK nuclease family protein, partial [Kofleriaceae bacterium]|nr:PD-(D/E)XK nuclease family protein [Kofleriaceae bacterium]